MKGASNKKTGLAAVIATFICAVIWNVNIVLHLVYGYTSTFGFVLLIVCAIVWDVCHIIWIFRYISSKKNDD